VTIRGIIFDLGWTLVDFDGDIDAAVDQRAADIASTLQARGFSVDGAALFKHYGAEARAIWEGSDWYEYPARLAMLRALRRHIPRADAARLVADVTTASFACLIPRWNLYPDALDMLTALRQAGYCLGGISNTNDGEHVWGIVDRCGLRDWLSPIHMSADVGLRKPHPRLFHMVLDEWQLPPGQVVMVGDTLNADVLGAHHAGMRGVWIDRGLTNPWSRNHENQDHITPDATIRQLAELPAVLASWNDKR
jgi:putative hydrolase of the HAD superfamily